MKFEQPAEHLSVIMDYGYNSVVSQEHKEALQKVWGWSVDAIAAYVAFSDLLGDYAASLMGSETKIFEHKQGQFEEDDFIVKYALGCTAPSEEWEEVSGFESGGDIMQLYVRNEIIFLGFMNKKAPDGFCYQVVSGEEGAQFKTEIFKSENLLLKEYKETGRNANKNNRAELQGQPILQGLLGPFYNGTRAGKHVIRYESKHVYAQFSQ